jgi:hypothetical protein
MANKGIFVGLGGAGVTTTAHLKGKLLAAAGSSEALDKSCRFIFIDTASDHIKRLNDSYRKVFGEEPLISHNERIDLGDVNPLAYCLRAKEKGANATVTEQRLNEFVDQRGMVEFKSAPLADGASGNRQQGRVALVAKSGQLQSKINDAVQALRAITGEQDQQAPLRFYILSGTCGGTGSSAFLDVAYIVDRTVKRFYPGGGDPKLYAVLFMPNWYIQYYKNKSARQHVIDNYQSNAFAFFDEVNFFLRDRYGPMDQEGTGERFKRVSVDPTIDADITAADRKWPVFQFAICVDSTTEQNSSMTDEQMYINTGEMLYYWHRGGTQEKMIANLDNELISSYASTPRNQAIPAFVTMGYRALQFPDRLMREYFKRRFLCELFDDGIVGESYENAFPDEDERRKELDTIYQQTVERYLFADKRESDVPNLESSYLDKVDNRIRALTSTEFIKTNTGLSGKLLGSGKAEYDSTKVSDGRRLNKLLEYAESISKDLNSEMEEAFASHEGKTGLESLKRFIQMGVRTAEGSARIGSIERALEDSILRFGLEYAIRLAVGLDTKCGETIIRLTDHKMELQSQLQAIEAAIDAARARCVADNTKAKERTNAFALLFNKLQEKLRINATTTILIHQTRILNDLSEGESGIIDGYRRKLEGINRAVRERLTGRPDDPAAVPGIRYSYETDLPKRFVETAKDVTTTYIPDVKTFVPEMHWTSDHLFAALYSGLVEQVRRPGGSGPLRHGDDFGRHPEVRGLHRVLRQLLTNREITGFEHGYEEDGEIVFFRKFFASAGSETPQRMINSLETYAPKYIEQLMLGSDKVKEEVEKPLLDRLNSLGSAERAKVIASFADANTQTFCAMQLGGDPPSVADLFVGNDDALAEALGFKDGQNKQLIPAESGNRFLKIKALTLQTISKYPHYEAYNQVYSAVREARKHSGDVFAPHIHRIFNEHGVNEGIRLLAQPTSGSGIELFAVTLLYREMFDLAYESNAPLLKEMVHVDDSLVGARKTCHSPLLAEQIGSSGEYRILVCRELRRQGGKLLFEYGTFENISGSVRSYKDIFDGIFARPYLEGMLKSVDIYFWENCSTAWLDVFDKAREKLASKIQTVTAANEEIRVFHENLNNSFVDVSRDLRTHIANRQKGTPTQAAAVGSVDFVP